MSRQIGGSEVKRYVLLDANNIIFKAHYIYNIQRSRAGLEPLKSRHGFDTSIVFGFLKFLTSWLRDIGNFSKVICFFDGVSQYRKTLYPDYKGNRPKGEVFPSVHFRLSDGTEVSTETQILEKLLFYMNVDVYRSPTLEADDLIAKFISNHQDSINIIVSDDKDYFQLLTNPRVVIFRPGDSQNRFVDAEVSKTIWSRLNQGKHPEIQPHQVRMFKALCGDSSDNIPGVPRIRKRVAAGLSNFGISELFSVGLNSLSDADRTRVLASKDTITTNYELVGFQNDFNLPSFLTPGINEFDLAKRIISDDCSIHDINVHSFKPKIDYVKPHIPDWLASI
jgi:DNA polymerase-1